MHVNNLYRRADGRVNLAKDRDGFGIGRTDDDAVRMDLLTTIMDREAYAAISRAA